MMTWNGWFFHAPTSFLMEVVVCMHDYVSLFLFSILTIVVATIIYLFMSSYFDLTFLENHQLETLWTMAPFVLLIFIVLPSLNSLYMLDSCVFCGVTLNIMGHQWYWTYFFKDLDFSFDSYMDTSISHLRLLEVDNRLLIPSYIPIRFLVSSSDVIHSWTIPSFGAKMDAVPGRINQFCLATKRTGMYFGQCSEICGANHSFMPIFIEAVSFKDFIKGF